ncbi:MAG: tetratricopeptide repeat protein [Planctomycetota bacterium]|nr:tetratricopeptide repeat protein [Planctomycetota bacterium]
MGNVTYAVNERARKLLKFAIIGLVVMLVLSPFFIFSNYGLTKMHSWALKNDSPRMLYAAARIHCMMGNLYDERFKKSQEYFEEFVSRYPGHKNAGYAYFYLAWSIEYQKRVDNQARRDEARDAYEEFMYHHPEHEKVPAAQRALNRIEVDSGR